MSSDEARELGPLFASFRGLDWMGEVVEAEHDVLVSLDDYLPEALSPHLYIFGLGCRTYGGTAQANHPSVGYFSTSRATELLVPPGLPEVVERNVLSHLLPLVDELEEKPILSWVDLPMGARLGHYMEVLDVIEPLLVTRDGGAVAARFKRQGGQAECWCFPPMPLSETKRWIKVALEVWAHSDPDRFSLPTQWWTRSEWSTASERSLRAALEQLELDRARLLGELDERRQDLEVDLDTERKKADSQQRLLLTAQNVDLVAAVADALGLLGFEIEDVDQSTAPGSRLEDLRAIDPKTDWIAVIEVRGYASGGAKSVDLLRVQRFGGRYMSSEGKPPSAIWYVINQMAQRPPEERPVPFISQPDDLAEFAESGGVVIDTRDLFKLSLATEEGALTPEDARQLLMDARGLFSLPQLPHESHASPQE